MDGRDPGYDRGGLGRIGSGRAGIWTVGVRAFCRDGRDRGLGCVGNPDAGRNGRLIGPPIVRILKLFPFYTGPPPGHVGERACLTSDHRHGDLAPIRNSGAMSVWPQSNIAGRLAHPQTYLRPKGRPLWIAPLSRAPATSFICIIARSERRSE